MQIMSLSTGAGQVRGEDQPRRPQVRWLQETEQLPLSNGRPGVTLGDPNDPLPRMYFVRGEKTSTSTGSKGVSSCANSTIPTRPVGARACRSLSRNEGSSGRGRRHDSAVANGGAMAARGLGGPGREGARRMLSVC